MSVIHGTGCFIEKEKGTVADPGEGPGGPGPPLIFRPKVRSHLINGAKIIAYKN